MTMAQKLLLQDHEVMLLTAKRDTAAIQLKLLLPAVLCDLGQVTSLHLASLSQKLLSVDQYQMDQKANMEELEESRGGKAGREGSMAGQFWATGSPWVPEGQVKTPSFLTTHPRRRQPGSSRRRRPLAH